MALTTVALNPGAGGANVVTDQQPSGAQMPISELAVSPDGVQASVAVTGLNPLPVSATTPIPVSGGTTLPTSPQVAAPVSDPLARMTLSAILVELIAIRKLLAVQVGQFVTTTNDN